MIVNAISVRGMYGVPRVLGCLRAEGHPVARTASPGPEGTKEGRPLAAVEAVLSARSAVRDRGSDGFGEQPTKWLLRGDVAVVKHGRAEVAP